MMALFLSLVVGAGAYAFAKAGNGGGVPVTTFSVKQEPMVVKVFATGRVKPLEEETLFAPYTGVVEEVLVEAGEQVEAGQILILFDTGELARKVREAEARLRVEEANLRKIQAGPREEELDKAQIRLEQAELLLNHAIHKLERMEKLYEAGATTAENLEAAKQEVANQQYALQIAQKELDILTGGERPEVLEAAEAQKKEAENSLLALQEQLEQGIVKAPMSGTVLEVLVKPGQLVTQGSSLLVIGDLNSLIVEVEISEGDTRDLALGQKVEVTGISFAGTYTGTVTKIAPAGKTLSGTQSQTVLPVKISLEGNPPIKPGVSAGEEVVINPPAELEDQAEVKVLPKATGTGR